jgi:endonuclease/exonuclease/phosphatase family metal-dependent hydrolase
LKRIIRSLLKVLNIVTAILLIVAAWGTSIPPKKNALPSILGLISPILFILSFLFLIYFIIKRKKAYWIISLLSLIIYFPVWLDYFNLRGNINKKYPQSFEILSYNVRQFDHYNWIEAQGTSNKIFDFLKKTGSDILCLQEFYNSPRKHFNSLDTLMECGRWTDYVYSPYFVKSYNVNSGLIIFSKFKIINSDIIPFSNSLNKAIYADILVYSDTVRVYNVHLESVHFSGIDYDIINGNLETSKNILLSFALIYSKLKSAFIQRSQQVELLEKEIKKCSYPLIIAGDFNDTPNSYVYHRLRNTLEDSFLNSGKGIGTTYVGRFPWLRIDYFFHNIKVENLEFYVCKQKLSDHFPLRAVFRIKDN